MALSPKVTAVLITREDAWPADTGLKLDLFDEVILETRCPGVHRRFELAVQARNEIVYVQDDDCSVDVTALHQAYRGRLTYAISAGMKTVYDKLCGSKACLIGWGALFPRRFADPLRWAAFVAQYGPVPSHEADRVFTFFCDRPHDVLVTPTQHLAREHAMSRDNRKHYSSREEILNKLLNFEVTW
jgi:hypothetical protein